MGELTSSTFAPVGRLRLADDLAERLVQMIRSGVYRPGDRLPPIMEMARNFGVGHPTLREALKKLELIGVVDIKHGSGVFVGSGQDLLLVSNPVFGGAVSKKLMLDLIDARLPIETRAATLAATQATEGHLQGLDVLMIQAGRSLADDEVLNRLNMDFHRQIAVASGNSVLAQLQEILTNLFQREQRMILSVYGSREKDHCEHLEILDALRRRDPVLARERMEVHVEGVRAALLQWDPSVTPLS
jgi:GntR family transcriptional regulator, transcriptional repressor for pyruvate dehydrogenase complex